jgi:hypothetical protein
MPGTALGAGERKVSKNIWFLFLKYLLSSGEESIVESVKVNEF